MKRILDWSKANWLILVMCVLILVGPTVGYVFANKLNNDIKTSREREAKSNFDQLNRAEVEYTVGAVLPGDQGISVRRVPHEQLTAYFSELRASRAAQVEEVVNKALERNKAGHEPLVEGLLPKPPERDDQLLRLEMQKRLVGEPGSPSVLVQMLETIDAGRPPDANEVATLLDAYHQGEIERHKAETGSPDMDGDKQKALQENLVKRRIGEYQRRANEISVYAERSAMPANFDRARGSEVPTVVDCFEWQWDIWIVQDLLDAVRKANMGADGELLRVAEAPVKRIIQIETTPLPGVFDESYSVNRNLPTTGPLIPTDETFSITGRVTHDKNELYDVRPATMSLIVSSAKLPKVLEAISATNFMTVTDLDITEVNLWSELRLGYYYGDEHVIRVDMQIETIWLREWVVPYMPESIRPYMSVEEGA